MPKIFIVVLLLCATLSLHSRSSYDASRLIMTIEVQETPLPGQSIPLCSGTVHFSRLFAPPRHSRLPSSTLPVASRSYTQPSTMR
jgi:hypothetical protein